MIELKNYMQDGANYQARAVLAYLSRMTIEDSWNDKYGEYDAKIYIGRWENCREQGYIVHMLNKERTSQINIAFFEHRNSDSICAVEWEQRSLNSLTIDTAKFGNVYKDKWDTSKDFGYGEAEKMAEWIEARLVNFW